MYRKYSDDFFKLCSVILESHEKISVRGLAPFLEIPRTTLQDGLKRVNDFDPADMSNEGERIAMNLVILYFENKTISSSIDDDGISSLYKFDIETSDFHSIFATSMEETFDHVYQEHFDFSDSNDETLIVDQEISKREEYLRQMKDEGFSDINDYVIKLVKQRQRLQDVSREERKVIRGATRAINSLEDINTEIINALKERKDFYPEKTYVPSSSDKAKGVLQLSDLHFGEIVSDTLANRFDMEVASKRLHKLVERTKKIFKSEGIESVAVLMTGDLINSTRRISEITSYAAPRVKVVFYAYLILGQVLESLYEDFNVTVAHVVGNESRLGEYFDSTNYLASDNFDLMLFDMLRQTHEKSGMTFVDSGDNPMEQVVEVNNVNFLLVHGNGHRGISHTNKIENEIQKIKARYAEKNIKIGYVLCGHIHSTYIANGFARSASLVGSNAFSERTLNFTSRASQNVFIVHPDSTVDGIMVDLQEYDGYSGYSFGQNSTDKTSTPLEIPKVHKVV